MSGFLRTTMRSTGSILEPPYHIFLEDLLLIVKDIDIKSSVDDSTSFIVEDKTENLITSLEEVSNTLLEWIKNSRK